MFGPYSELSDSYATLLLLYELLSYDLGNTLFSMRNTASAAS